MALFQSIAEIVASLTPRRPRHGQSDDQQQTDAHSIHQHSHSSLAPHHSSQVPAYRPSRRVRHSWNQYSLGSESDDADLSFPHLSPNRDPAARLQVCDTPKYRFATVLSGSTVLRLCLDTISRVESRFPSVDGLFVPSTIHTQLFFWTKLTA